jgi:hypothetical protein
VPPLASGNLSAMGIAFRVDPATGMTVSVWHGNVSAEDALRHMRDLWATPEWGSGARILSDLTGVSSSALPPLDQVAELAAAFANLIDGRTRKASWAVVANLGYQHASQFADAIRHEVRRVMVFSDLVSACLWLGVDAEALRPVIESLRIEVQTREPERAD